MSTRAIIQPYLQDAYYTVHLFSLRTCYPDPVREDFRRKELEEQERLDRRDKTDLINWKIKR